jgi:hypothetical protein
MNPPSPLRDIEIQIAGWHRFDGGFIETALPSGFLCLAARCELHSGFCRKGRANL